MTDTPAAPAPVDPHPPAPLAPPATPAEARARQQSLVDDKEWAARWVAGGVAERQIYQQLSELASQADPVAEALAGTTSESNLIQTLGPNELSTRDLASAVEMFRDKGLDESTIQQAMRGGEVSRAEYMAAKTLKSARLGDEAWVARWLKGGWSEGREMLLINTIVSSFKEK